MFALLGMNIATLVNKKTRGPRIGWLIAAKKAWAVNEIISFGQMDKIYIYEKTVLTTI